MDSLTDEERILAWKSTWNPSFAGIAIVNKDFTFRSVNPQFCKLLGVTPADLIGKRFQDITPIQIRELDEKNSQLIMDGNIDFYLLPKTYAFQNGSTVDVVLLVTRAPAATDGEFQFFISRIMLDEKGELLTFHNVEQLRSQLSSPKLTQMAGEFLMANGKWLMAIGTIIGAAVVTIIGTNK